MDVNMVLEALSYAEHVLREQAEVDAGTPYWNEGGDGYEAYIRVRYAIAHLERIVR